MNMKNIFYCLLPGLLFGACSNKVYEETGDSVIVKVPVHALYAVFLFPSFWF